MFGGIRKFWVELMAIPGVPFVVWGTVLLMLLAIAWYVVSRFRGLLYETVPDRDAYLGTFRDLRDQGLLEEDEYQRLKRRVRGGPDKPAEAVATGEAGGDPKPDADG